MKEMIKKYVEEYQEEALELLKTIAKIPAPSNQEEKRMEFCEKWLKDMGAEGVYTDDALNVVYPYGVTEDNPVVVFMAHIDIVFPDTEELPLREENRRLYCPGIGDDTANLVNILIAAKHITKHHFPVKDLGVVFVCNAGEEGLGNLKGVRKICETYGNRIKELYSFDCQLDDIICCAVGSKRYEVTIKTQGGHSYNCFGRPNAIERMSALICELYQMQVPKTGKTTYNVGMIQGGTSVNTIAQEAKILCEVRSDLRENMLGMTEIMEQIFKKYHAEVKIVGERPCENLSKEAFEIRKIMIEKAKKIIEETTGKAPVERPASTDCNIPLSLNIPSICFGTYYGDGAHTREEYVELDSLKYGYEVAIKTILSAGFFV